MADFGELLKSTSVKMPLHKMIDIEDVGNMAAFLVSDLSKTSPAAGIIICTTGIGMIKRVVTCYARSNERKAS